MAINFPNLAALTETMNGLQNSQGFKDFSGALRNMADQQQKYLAQQHMNKVFAANPEFATKLYDAQNQQGQLAMQQQHYNQIAENDRIRNAINLQKIGSGGDLPAPLQITNDYLKAVKEGDNDRAQAILMFAKALDKGVMPGPDGQTVALPGYGEAVGGIAAAKSGMSRQAEKNVDVVMNPKIASGEAAARLQQDLAYSPTITKETTYAKETSANKAQKEASFSKVQKALSQFENKSNTVQKFADEALTLLNKPAGLAGGYGQVVSFLPNNDARKLNNALSTIKANIGFDALQEMRDNSPTGGALGPVSDLENKLLQAVNGALDPLQEDQLASNLNLIKELYPQLLEERRKAFAIDYPEFSDSKTSREVNLNNPSTLIPSPAQAAPAVDAGPDPSWKLYGKSKAGKNVYLKPDGSLVVEE